MNKLSFLILLLCCGNFAMAQDSTHVVKTGAIPAAQIFDLVYVPFEVPEGTTAIRVKESYDQQDRNVLNMGIYDSRGYQGTDGFRGWSGGAKKEFFINEAEASTGYIAGMIPPGTWNVLVYPSAIAAEGLNWKLEITLISGKHRKVFAVRPAAAKINTIAGWYRGDLHMHTLHSDGRRTTTGLVEEAKAKKLDFIISTEHNTNAANLEWGKYDSPELLIINGEEVTSTKYGHWNAIGLDTHTLIDWRYQPEDNVIRRYTDQVHQDGGLAVINHPFYDKGDKTFKFDEQSFDAIEIWNGQWNPLNELALKWWDELLRRGTRKIAIAASDTHKMSGSLNNLGRPQTVVYAAGLSKASVLEGIKNGKVYLAATDSIRLQFRLKSGSQIAGIGEKLNARKDQSISVHIQVAGGRNAVMTLLDQDGIISRHPVEKELQDFELKTGNRAARYLRVELRRQDGTMLALTNPVWL